MATPIRTPTFELNWVRLPPDADGREVLHGITSRSTPRTLSLVSSREDPATARHPCDHGSVRSPDRLWAGKRSSCIGDSRCDRRHSGNVSSGRGRDSPRRGNHRVRQGLPGSGGEPAVHHSAGQPGFDSPQHRDLQHRVGWPGDVVPRSDVHGAKDEDIRRGRSAGRDVLLRLPSAHGHGRHLHRRAAPPAWRCRGGVGGDGRGGGGRTPAVVQDLPRGSRSRR